MPKAKAEKVTKQVRKCLINKNAANTLRLNALASTIGQVIASLPAVKEGRLHAAHLCHTQTQVIRKAGWNHAARATLTPRAQAELTWWLACPSCIRARPVSARCTHHEITAMAPDASDLMMAGVPLSDARPPHWHRHSSRRERRKGIACKELLAVWESIQRCQHKVKSSHLNVRCNNSVAAAALNKWGSRDESLRHLSLQVFSWAVSTDTLLTATCVACHLTATLCQTDCHEVCPHPPPSSRKRKRWHQVSERQEAACDQLPAQQNRTDERDSDGARTAVAQRGMVQQNHSPVNVSASHPSPTHSESNEPIQKVLSRLELDFSEAIREAEIARKVPHEAQLLQRIAASIVSNHNAAWKALRQCTSENPAALRTTPPNSSEDQMPALLLAAFGTHTRRTRGSGSRFQQTAAAVGHCLQTLHATPTDIIRNTSKPVARKLQGSTPREDVPNVHDALRQTCALHRQDTAKARRARLIAAMMLLGTERFSDLARHFRDDRSLQFTVHRLDAPEWARKHRFTDLDTFHRCGYLRQHQTLHEHDFIVLKPRPFHAKTALAKGRLCGNWIRLTENRFAEAPCPVLATIGCIDETRTLRISSRAPIGNADKAGSPDDTGRNHRPAKPLFTQLNRSLREPLQPDTLSGIIARETLKPLDLHGRFVPFSHSLKATSASCKMAHGVPLPQVLKMGDWSSHHAFFKHHCCQPMTEVNPGRLRDALLHDWRLSRAHVLLHSVRPPLQRLDTNNDEAMAHALALQRAGSVSRRRGHQ
eukprot:jgi/Bigna1/68151/fgenesh1_pg.5_\